MSATKRLQRQVSPKTTALVILVVVALVQAAWWRGLVWRPPLKAGPPSGMAQMTGTPPGVLGRRDVRVDTLAGSVEPGDADGPGRNARFDSPAGIALDAAGNLYIADCLNDRIRRMEPNGRTSTVAGSTRGFADGPTSSARFCMPCGVAVGPDGAIYVADTGNQRIRVVRGGTVTTLAGGVRGFADGVGAAARFDWPCSIQYVGGARPALLVADAMNRRVRSVGLDGRVQGGWTVPGAPTCVGASPPAVAVPQAGQIATAASRLTRIPVDASQLDSPEKLPPFLLTRPVALCASPTGWYAADDLHGAVFEVRSGVAEVLAGACFAKNRLDGGRDGTGDRCSFGHIGGLAADGKGRIYLSDTTNNAIRCVKLPEAIGPDEEDSTESRDRRTDEGLRRWYLRDQGY